MAELFPLAGVVSITLEERMTHKARLRQFRLDRVLAVESILQTNFRDPNLLAYAIFNTNLDGQFPGRLLRRRSLAFHGDAILRYAVLDYIYRSAINGEKGIAASAASLNSNRALYELAVATELAQEFIWANGFKLDRQQIKTLGTFYEAILGAIDRDQGILAAMVHLERFYFSRFDILPIVGRPTPLPIISLTSDQIGLQGVKHAELRLGASTYQRASEMAVDLFGRRLKSVVLEGAKEGPCSVQVSVDEYSARAAGLSFSDARNAAAAELLPRLEKFLADELDEKQDYSSE